MEEELFYKLPKSLVRAVGYFSPKDGSPVKFTSTEKIVYIYMLDRISFFVDVQKGKHFESQQSIADGCGMEYKAVGKVLRGFIENGVLEAKKGVEAGSSHNRYYYTGIVKNLELWEGSIDKPESIRTSARRQQVLTEEAKPPIIKHQPEYYDDVPDWAREPLPF